MQQPFKPKLKNMYKRLLLLLLSSMCISFVKSQHFAVSNSVENVLYRGFENRLDIAIENTPCSSVFLASDIGKISGEGCEHFFYTDEGRYTNIVVYEKTKEGLREIGKKFFTIVSAPDPKFLVGPSFGGRLSCRILILQDTVRALYQNFNLDENAQVDSFTVNVLSTDSSSNRIVKVVGNKIPAELKKIFKSLKHNDELIFDDIYVLGIDKSVRRINSVTYNLFE
jgi:hypothetical protein